MKLRFISILLAILMTAPAIVSCSEAPDQQSESTSSGNSDTETNVETDEKYDANGYLLDDLPDDLDYEGQIVSVLYWEDVENPEFWVDDFNAEPVNDAIHQRNINVEDTLNIRYNWVGTAGNLNNRTNYISKARSSVMAGDGAYDIFAAYSATVAGCAANSLLIDLSKSPYIDYEKPWWPQNLIEEVTIGDNIYFVSGDISTNILHMMYAIIYSDSILDEYTLTNPVEYVNEGTWTIDKLIEMSDGVYRDLNGNGNTDSEDMYGFVLTSWHNDAFYTGSDIKLVEKDPDNLMKISDDFYGDRVLTLLEKIGQFEKTDDVFVDDSYDSVFRENRSLFILNRVQYAAKYLRDVDFTHGLVPVPKLDEEQESYKTCLGHPITLYGISRDSRIGEIAHAVIECAASQAHRLTTPAIFENNMQKKYSNDDIDAQMYDVIRESITFDLGRIFTRELFAITDIFTGAVASNNGTWSSNTKKLSGVLNKSMAELTDKFREAEALLDQD